MPKDGDLEDVSYSYCPLSTSFMSTPFGQNPKDVDPKDLDPKDVDPKDVDPKDGKGWLTLPNLT